MIGRESGQLSSDIYSELGKNLNVSWLNLQAAEIAKDGFVFLAVSAAWRFTLMQTFPQVGRYTPTISPFGAILCASRLCC
jgi:hypothetical protein